MILSVQPGEIDAVGRRDVEELGRFPGSPCVTVYLPTHRAGAGTQQDPIRLKNLLRRAGDLLPAEAAPDLLGPAVHLLDDTWFWRHQADGLSLFLGPGFFRAFRLPMAVEESVTVAGSFHLGPLLPLLTGDGRFFILAISQNEVRLFEATRLTVARLDTPGVPRSLAEALAEAAPRPQLQVRSVAPLKRGERTAMFHGHGGGQEDRKAVLERYLRAVDRAVCPLLGSDRRPLVLAAVAYYLPVYRRVSRYPELIDEAVDGNPEGVDATALHARAWPILEPRFAAARRRALEDCAESLATGRAVSGVEAVTAAAVHGRLATLVVTQGVRCWGRYDEATAAAEVHGRAGPDGADAVDLVDVAVTETMLAGGDVFCAAPGEIQGRPPVVGIVRY